MSTELERCAFGISRPSGFSKQFAYDRLSAYPLRCNPPRLTQFTAAKPAWTHRTQTPSYPPQTERATPADIDIILIAGVTRKSLFPVVILLLLFSSTFSSPFFYLFVLSPSRPLLHFYPIPSSRSSIPFQLHSQANGRRCQERQLLIVRISLSDTPTNHSERELRIGRLEREEQHFTEPEEEECEAWAREAISAEEQAQRKRVCEDFGHKFRKSEGGTSRRPLPPSLSNSESRSHFKSPISSLQRQGQVLTSELESTTQSTMYRPSTIRGLQCQLCDPDDSSCSFSSWSSFSQSMDAEILRQELIPKPRTSASPSVQPWGQIWRYIS